MIKKERSLAKINDDIKTAGQSFLGLYLGNMIGRINELDDKELKTRLIEEYYSQQHGFYDSKSSGTRVRVDSAVRSIRADKVVYTLERIDGSDSRVSPEAVIKAKETIEHIQAGKLALPTLE